MLLLLYTVPDYYVRTLYILFLPSSTSYLHKETSSTRPKPVPRLCLDLLYLTITVASNLVVARLFHPLQITSNRSNTHQAKKASQILQPIDHQHLLRPYCVFNQDTFRRWKMRSRLVSILSFGFLVPATPTEISFPGDKFKSRIISPLPHTYLKEKDIPREFFWGNVSGISYLTHSLNQHIPQYCGSCWAHSSMSSLADRIKIARNASGTEINLAVQFLLNCGQPAGSCQGGSAIRAYEFIHEKGYIPYDTCLPYIACSEHSTNGFCPHVDTTCTPMNICRSCTNPTKGGSCSSVNFIPNATVEEYGNYHENELFPIMAEILMRGPVKASVNAGPLEDYQGGILLDNKINRNTTHNHGVSIVGWGYEEELDIQYWIIRNSWGQYWGELGFFRVELGKNLLGIEAHVSWATPGSFTVQNFPCSEDGNCEPKQVNYIDPSTDRATVQRRLRKS